MYYLSENVYLVNGAINAAVYDLNRNLIYQLPKPAKDLLNKCLEEDCFNELEEMGISAFLKADIITNDYVERHSIEDLKKELSIDFAWIEVTTRCNYRCIHCYEEASTFGGNNMSFDDFCHAIDRIQEYGIKRIQIIGGEPCILGNELLRYLDYAVGKFERIIIYTNGSLVTDEMIAFFKKHSIVILLSVYSYDSVTHDKVTKVTGSHIKTVDTISKLKDAGISYRAKNVIMDGVCPGEKSTNLYTLNPHKDIVRLTGRANLDLLSADLLKKKMITVNSFKRPINREFISLMVSGHNCFGRRLYVSWDLNLYPCVMERRIFHGNLRENKLRDLLKEDIMKMNKDAIEGCKVCELRYACTDCRPDSFGRGITEKPWYCTYNPTAGIWEDAAKQANDIIEENGKCYDKKKSM